MTSTMDKPRSARSPAPAASRGERPTTSVTASTSIARTASTTSGGSARAVRARRADARDDDGRPVAGGVDNDDAVRERETRAADMDRGRCVCAFAPARVGARRGVWRRPRAGGEEFSLKNVGSLASRTIS